MPFIPTQEVMQELIRRAANIKSEYDILNSVNPKERKRLINEQDLEEPIHAPYCELRILPTAICYPQIEDNWPDFFFQTGLGHLAEKYKPTKLKQLEAEAEPSE